MWELKCGEVAVWELRCGGVVEWGSRQMRGSIMLESRWGGVAVGGDFGVGGLRLGGIAGWGSHGVGGCGGVDRVLVVDVFWFERGWGEWFGLPFPAAERRGLLLATLAGEAAMNYVGWSGADLVGYHYTAAGRFERAWRRGLAAEADTVFRVAVPGRQTDFLGWCDRSSGRIDLIGGRGGLAEGFPLAGTGAFRLVEWGERLVLLVANGASVYAYQLGGWGKDQKKRPSAR